MRSGGERGKVAVRRGVSPILATVLLVIITVVLATILYIFLASFANPSLGTPLPSSFAWGSARADGTGTAHVYDFGISTANGGILLNNLVFQLLTPGGMIVKPTGFALTALEAGRGTVGTYNFTAASWTAGGTEPVSTAMTFQLSTGATAVSGDQLVALGANGYQGQVAVTVP
jgi:flagellin-like protein